MKVLIKKDWEYTVYEEDGKVYLEVLCGSSALFEVKIMLSEEEKEKIATEPLFINELSKKVRNNPDNYLKKISKQQ